MRREISFKISLVIATFLVASALAHAQTPNDPLFSSTGTWGQSYADQWGLARIGTSTAPATPNRPWIIVAVIDSGIDYTHAELPLERIWRNERETLNGVDDDGNGYVDDVIGWNFADGDNNPFDRAGHGTHVAGIIAAATNNGVGMAGVDANARIMPLKVLNFIGRGRSSHIAAAIYYAIANGAKVINLSLSGERLSAIEERAIAKASAAGVITVIAAGNEGRELQPSSVFALPNVLIVAASDVNDKRARFSNWGKSIKVTAPGVDILSLRARDTDLIRFSGAASYQDSAASVGNGQYYRASGTSFAAAFVSGTLSWLWSNRPTLSAAEVSRVIMQSARDAEAPGIDALVGYGIIDGAAALAWDPTLWLEASIDDVTLSANGSATRVRVVGTADASQFAKARVRAAPERFPNDWIELGKPLDKSQRQGVLVEFDPILLRGPRRWVLQLIVTHANGKEREARWIVDLGAKP